MDDLFDSATRAGPAAPDAEPSRTLERERILVFDIAVLVDRESPWQDLFPGYAGLPPRAHARHPYSRAHWAGDARLVHSEAAETEERTAPWRLS
jgi:hypothetical protein